MSDLIRWVWKAGAEEFHLDHLYLRANEDQFPYAAGHQFTLRWRDPFYPAEMGMQQRERFITEDFRRNAAVVRSHGVAGLPFWTEHVTGDLTVQVALAVPEQRFGDNMAEGSAFRVSYQCGGQKLYVARADVGAAMSRIAATELVG